MGWQDRFVPVLDGFCRRFVDEGLCAGAFAIDREGSELARAGDFRGLDTTAIAAHVAQRLDTERLLADGTAVVEGAADGGRVHVRVLGTKALLVVLVVPPADAARVAALLDEVAAAVR